MDLDQGVVARGGQRARLTTLELRLLEFLAGRPHQEVDRDELLIKVWGYRPGVVSRSVDNTVRRLRQKIEATPREPGHILTVHRMGYRFEPAPEEEAPPPPERGIEGLPSDRDRFFGREEDLEKLSTFVQSSRAMVIVGPPGVGKSRLAREWVRAGVSNRGLAWVALGSATTRSEVLLAIARVLGLRPGDKDDLDVRLGNALRLRGPTLLVLDETERAQEEVDALLRGWLPKTLETLYLLTSRRQPALPGSSALLLEPLPPSPARALLLDRARRAAGLAWGANHEEADVEELAKRLEGLPLALELASARAHLLRPRDLVQHLDERLDRLAGVRGRGPRGRSSLRAALETSWHLLSAGDQAVLAGLSLFRGPFGLVEAEGVFGDVLDTLDRLVDHSFLRASAADPPGHGVRFRLLETIRLFAAERLSKADAARERHAGWHADLADRLARAARLGDPAPLHRLVERLDDLRAILDDPERPLEAGRIARAIHPSVRDRLPSGEWVAILRTVADRLPASHQELSVDLGLARVESLTNSGRRHEAQRELDNLAEVVPEASTLRARLLHRRGALLQLAERLEEAEQAFSEALGMLAGPEVASVRAHVLVSLGAVRTRMGRLVGAREAYEEGLALARRDGNRRVLWRCHCALGNHAIAGALRTSAACDHYRQALVCADELGDDRGRALVWLNRAYVLRMRDDLAGAEEDLRSALAAVEAQGFGRARGHALLGLANLLRDVDRMAEARPLLQDALECTRVHADRRFEAHVLDSFATIAHLEGRLDEAEERYQQVIEIYENVNMEPEVAVVSAALAVALGDQGRVVEGRELLDGVALDQLGELHLAVYQVHQAHIEILEGGDPDLEGLRATSDHKSSGLRRRLALRLLDRARVLGSTTPE